MQRYDELLVTVTLCVPTEAADVLDGLVERTQFIQLRQRLLHQLGILVEEFALI